jgi:tetratricopeptide (TPR) repeat protein
MAKSTRCLLTLAILAAMFTAHLRAQQDIGDPPQPLVPQQPLTKHQLDTREARRLFAKGLVCQREDRLLEALRLFEKARQLDPNATSIHRALIPLYLALGRPDDSLAACRRAVELDPADHETWYVYARQLQEQGQAAEAVKALERAVGCPDVKEHLDLLVQMYYDLGVLHEDSRDYSRAESAFRQVADIFDKHNETLLESGPYNPEQIQAEAAKTYERIGQVCTKGGMYDKAVAAFMQAQKRDPDRAARLSYNLAQVYLAQSKPSLALRQLDQYLKTQPQGAEAYELKINILKKLRREADVLPALEQAARGDEHNIPLHILLARQYARERRWDNAERSYAELARQSPTPDVYRGWFDMLKERGEPGRVLDQIDQTLKTAAAKDDGEEDDQAADVSPRAASAAARARAMLTVLRDDPELVKAVLKEAERELANQRPRYRTTLRYLAILAARTRQVAIAEKLYRSCLPTITEKTESEIYGGLLDVLLQQSKWQEVVDLCREGEKKAQATNLLVFHIKKAPALLRLGKTDEAIAAMDEAVKLADDANRLGIHARRVDILRQAEQYDRAVKDCEALLKEFTRPGEIREIRHVLSNVYSSANEHAKAEEQLRLILEDDPNDATANNDLGYIMADQGKNLEEAEKLIRKAIDLDVAEKKRGKTVGTDGDNANAAYIDSLGWVLFRLGKLDEARAELEKATALSAGEDDPTVWDHLGDVYYRLKQTKAARTAWEKAAQLYELEKRAKSDERYQEIKHKLENLR